MNRQLLTNRVSPSQVDYSHASASFLGWVVAAYSFGQLVASPFFGAWADWRPTREPLVFSLVITVVFNLLYSWTGAFSADIAGWILLISRALVGFGAGMPRSDEVPTSWSTSLQCRAYNCH